METSATRRKNKTENSAGGDRHPSLCNLGGKKKLTHGGPGETGGAVVKRGLGAKVAVGSGGREHKGRYLTGGTGKNVMETFNDVNRVQRPGEVKK